MAKIITAIESKNGPRLEKVAVKSDTATDQTALFPSSIYPDDSNQKEAANCILIPTSGNVKVRLVRGLDADGQLAPNVDITKYLVAGIWHISAPFDHVYATGTDPADVIVGVTSWNYNVNQ
jgi:hypothetical protein